MASSIASTARASMAVFRFRCSLYTVLGWLHERNDADAGWILLRLARVCQWARDDLRTIELLQIPLVGFNRKPQVLQCEGPVCSLSHRRFALLPVDAEQRTRNLTCNARTRCGSGVRMAQSPGGEGSRDLKGGVPRVVVDA